MDEHLDPVHWSDVPTSDETAFDYFTFVRDMGATFHPRYIQTKRAGESEYTLLPVVYYEADDSYEVLNT